MSRSRLTRNRSSPEAVRSVRESRSRRTELSGLDLNPDDDEEYSDNAEDSLAKAGLDQDDEDVGLDDEDEDEANILKRSSRKRKVPIDEDEDDNEAEEQDDNEVEEQAEDEEDEEEEEDEDEVVDGDEEGVNNQKNTAVQLKLEKERRGPKKRGRKKMKITILEDGAFDEEGNPLNINDDEVVIENEDPKGLEKIDELGRLKGGRKFRVKTFTLLGKGEKLYMVSTEPARLVGFRDSYLLFKTHRSLFKKVCNNEEKMDLIDRHIIPNSYKGRSVNLVAARSIYREFGAMVIHDGKKVIDDFWEQKAIDNGDVPGEYADPGELFRNNQGKLANPIVDSNSNSAGTPISGAALVNYQTDPTWMYQIALQTRAYNLKLLEQRSQGFSRGMKDAYTGLNFYPISTQPTFFKIAKTGESSDNTIERDTKFVNIDIRKKITGLSSIPKEIFNDLEDEEIKTAILEQQAYEKLHKN